MSDRITVVREVTRVTVDEPAPLVAEVATAPQGPAGAGVPPVPTGDGVYTLRCTVAGGSAVVAWVPNG